MGLAVAAERYSKVTRRMWNDERFKRLSAPPPNGQTLWQRLLTGPELGPVPGVFQAWEAGLAQALGWPLKGFREAFAEVLREGLAKADWTVGLVWVPKALKHNEPQSPNVIKMWAKEWKELPDCTLKDEAFRGLKAFAEALPKAFAEAFSKAFAEELRKPLRNQEQEQEQEQEDVAVRAREDDSNTDRPHPKQLASKGQATGEAEHEAKGSTRAGSTTTTRIPVEVDPRPDRSEPTATDQPVSSLRDPLAYLSGKAPGQRSDVCRLHEAYKAEFGYYARKLGPNDLDAQTLADALESYGQARCELVLRHARQDGMVNGSLDDGRRHDTIRYIFGNSDAFNRILRDAERTAPEQMRKRPASEVIAAAKRGEVVQ